MTAIYDFEARLVDGQTQKLDAFRGQAMLIANVASRCAFTPQYAQLETLYRAYRERGFVVLAFPCNQFGGQEPLAGQALQTFCSTNYSVTYPVFDKIDVNGPTADPLFRYLTSARRGLLGTRAIKWNFTKFLVDRRGQVVSRYSPIAHARRIERDLQTVLDEPLAVPWAAGGRHA